MTKDINKYRFLEKKESKWMKEYISKQEKIFLVELLFKT